LLAAFFVSRLKIHSSAREPAMPVTLSGSSGID
jgi:hypothetical protein